jgi:hypothetical protein
VSPSRKADAALAEHAPLVDALSGFVRSLVAAELEALGRKVEDLDVALSRRIADLDERAESTLSELKREMQTDLESVRATAEATQGRLGGRVDEIAAGFESVAGGLERELRPRMDTLDRLVGELDERLAKRIREATHVEQELRSSQEALAERLAASEADLGQRLRAAVEQAVAAREIAERELGVERAARQALGQRVQALSESVAAAERGIQQQLDTSQRLSTVLNTLTSVFTAQRSPAPPGGGATASPESRDPKGSPDAAAGTISDSSLADLDSALNKLFPR